MDAALLHQFSGFLKTPQIGKKTGSFPYSTYEVVNNMDIQQIPADLHLPPTMVLGKRMERFFQFYVTHFTDEQIMAHNEQIIFEKKTLGELDFLLKNKKTGKVCHVELVYKFYLYDPEIKAKAERWTGPNHRDNLSRKLERLRKNQFPLLYRAETRPLLERLGISTGEVEQRICFKANLFLPWQHPSLKEDMAMGAAQGFWMRTSEFLHSGFGEAEFYSPKKPDWPIDPQNNTRWFSFETIRNQIDPLLERKQSPLIWMKTREGKYQRFFLVWW